MGFALVAAARRSKLTHGSDDRRSGQSHAAERGYKGQNAPFPDWQAARSEA